MPKPRNLQPCRTDVLTILFAESSVSCSLLAHSLRPEWKPQKLNAHNQSDRAYTRNDKLTTPILLHIFGCTAYCAIGKRFLSIVAAIELPFLTSDGP